MIDLTLEEAQLFRILTGFFGKERVVPRVSVLSICGGEPPAAVGLNFSDMELCELKAWMKRNSCLFTVINDEGDACLVIEFASDFTEIVDLGELERRKLLLPLLAAVSIPYITITGEEFSDMLTPGAPLDIFTFLRDKFEGLIPD